MTERRQFIGYDTDTLSTFVGEDREIILNTTNKSLTVHDGSKAGGYETARADLSNVSEVIVNSKATDKEDKSNKVDTLEGRAAENYPSVVAVNNALAIRDQKIESNTNDIASKADKSTTLSGYGIVDAYTKTEVDGQVSSLDQRITTNTNEIVLRQTIANMEAQLGESSTSKYPSSKAVADYVRSTILNVSGIDNVVSNCITKIPQDIKLELSNGTLTLKAGSKVYKPNGVGVFNGVVIESDVSRNSFGTVSGSGYIIVYVTTRKSLSYDATNKGGSSGTSLVNGWFYKTDTNEIIGVTNGADNGDRTALPICSVTLNNGVITSIDQVFNGFSYIGSSIFALPGVEGMIPNGRDADGKPLSIKFTISSLLVNTNSGSSDTRQIVVNANKMNHPVTFYYDDVNNINTSSDVGVGNKDPKTSIGTCVFSKGRIISFLPKTTFQAVDRNDAALKDLSNISYAGKQSAISWGMPDYSSAISISSPYTAPKNGIVFVRCTGTNGWFPVLKVNGVEMFIPNSYGGGWALVSKGDVASLDNANNAGSFVFIPFKGEN